jgi:2-polyprenyl-3-methyl-5-hydroxy-6-metoxy-1,4-benzoquinol methylase
MEQHKTDDLAGRASTLDDWDGYYGARQASEYKTLDYSDFRNMPFGLIFEKIKEYFPGGSVLEVGAGDSDVLIEVCKKLKPTSCTGLDYARLACDKLSEKAQKADADIDVVCADMFAPDGALLKNFDFVMSHGVVEHFYDLPKVLGAISSFAKPGGTVFTLIPSHKRTIYGWLMKRWNKEVFDAHVMYDLDDLLAAHRAIGLEIVWGEYLCSSNFGMLSWCFKDREHGVNYWIYTQLTRLSKLIWFFESKFGKLKATSSFAPFAVVVARTPA